MKQIINLLNQMNSNYQQLRRKAEAAITQAPDWRVRCSDKKGRHYYYYRDSADHNAPKCGRYADRSHMKSIAAIVQNEYSQALINEIDRQQLAIRDFIDSCAPDRLEALYTELSPARRALVKPLCVSDEEYAASWQAHEYDPKPFAEGTPEIYTERGERVRSKSEKIIADKLRSLGIPYRYECPINLKGIGTVYPDFTVLNISARKHFFWEHLGMMDDPEYSDNALHRIDLYEKNGFFLGTDLILTYETSARPLDTKLLNQMIEHYLLK